MDVISNSDSDSDLRLLYIDLRRVSRLDLRHPMVHEVTGSIRLAEDTDCWNAVQALFSFLVVYNIIPEVIEYYQASGVKGLDCDSNFMKGTTGAWHFAFVLSKVIDLVDTFFIVLRKRPLLFLHYYHHVATMVAGFASECTRNRFPSACYYAAAAMRIKIPGWLARWITSVQISQFVLGAAFAIHATVEFFSEAGCGNMIASHLLLGWFINLSFLALFINFFRKSYVVDGGKQKYRDDSSEKKQEQKRHYAS